MKSFLDKIFFKSNNIDDISERIRNLTIEKKVIKIFDAINNFSDESEIRYVGGCIRKIINREKVDDIDLATNLEPKHVCEALTNKDIDYFESGITHGTITAIIDNQKFEITTLRDDILTDGRHAKVKFSKNWKNDALRRDFTFNSIYSDKDGNLFDPFNGKKDLENGLVIFIGDADKRIKEDFLRILRYLRFFLNYSKHPHNFDIIKTLKINIEGISKLSKERTLDELKKIMKLETLENLSKDKLSKELILLIFPELRNINIFSKLNSNAKNILLKEDFIFLISLMIIDKTDNLDYFLYKFNISKKDQKRMKIIDNFYKDKNSDKFFNQKNMDKFFYYNGKQAVLDILNFKIVRQNKIDENLKILRDHYEKKSTPKMSINADFLMSKYGLLEGKKLGEKLKEIEEVWVNSGFEITDNQVDNIINN